MTASVARGLDVVTGALGRAQLEAELYRAVSEARKSRSPLSLVYVDVDEYQEHEDSHGVEALHPVLSWLVDQMVDVFGGVGPLGRLDTDGFVAMLPGIEAARAYRLAEVLRFRVGACVHELVSGPLSMTVSVGVAGLKRHEPWGNLLEAAEVACRKAKQGGRDRTVHR